MIEPDRSCRRLLNELLACHPRLGLALGGPQTKFPLLAGQNLPLTPSISILRFCDTASVLMAFLASLIIIIQSDPFEAAISGYF